MIMKLLIVLTEYISILLCLYKTANKKIKVSKSFFICLGIYMILLFLFRYNKTFYIMVYGFWFLYTWIGIVDNLKAAIKSYSIMVITIPTMQMILYTVLAFFVQYWMNNENFISFIQLVINMIICFIILLWKNEYLYNWGTKFKKINKIVISVLVTAIIAYVMIVFKNKDELMPQLLQQLVICMAVWGLTVMVLASVEMEKKHKAEELKLYEQYTHAFEDALTVIKMRQHEFDNHINAINCMRYVIEDKEDLIKEQQEYCKNIKNENIYNKVLLLKIPLILSGYLYSKFTIAEGKGIRVEYMIQELKEDNRVSLNDLIEIIGILFDNAMEELESKGKTHMEVNIYYDNVDRLIVEIINESGKVLNTEIEKFFKNGYSTKGENRGMGLYRLMYLKKKYKADLVVNNFEKAGLFYLMFQIGVANNKKRSQ